VDDITPQAIIAIGCLTVVGLVGLLIYEAVTDERADYAGICLDDITYERVDEARCGDFDDEGHDSADGVSLVWIDVSSTTHIPARGERVSASYGIRTVPKGKMLTIKTPITGGQAKTITRGGLGISGAVKGGSAS
jgi:hypothetical protein